MMTDEVIQLDKKRVQPPAKKPMPWEEFYELYRKYIVDEHNILNQRTIWLAISQSFFFGGYASVANAPKEAKSPIFAAQQELLLWLLPSAALIACFCVFLGIIARSMNLESTKRKFELCSEEDENYPLIDGTTRVKRMEIFSIWVLPIIFMVTWLVILIRQFIHA
ncbi:hypothetical protein [Emticicia sp. C21]|uniref:hypothetical protein n=1 Tax=Emticicia sp. C21 TaxID=2302915 RepID=UPI000E861DA7|nr:hypothetical protein [Emticicia sp. C21]RFS15509.1 hypothetical protein D0T08_15275 [Emticicia sp. C21]